jgi:ribosome-binding factor A
MVKSSAPSQRQLRVGELIRHELSAIFSRGEVVDPVIERLGVTVYEVTASPDLKSAICWVRPFVSGDGEELVKALERHRRYIRGLLAPRLGLRYMPDLRFRLDTSLDYASRIDRLFAEPAVRRDIEGGSQGDDKG